MEHQLFLSQFNQQSQDIRDPILSYDDLENITKYFSTKNKEIIDQ